MEKTIVEELYEKIESLKERNEDLQAEIIKRNRMLTERFGVPPAEVELLFKVEPSNRSAKIQELEAALEKQQEN